jgi:hypothetical protein
MDADHVLHADAHVVQGGNWYPKTKPTPPNRMANLTFAFAMHGEAWMNRETAFASEKAGL